MEVMTCPKCGGPTQRYELFSTAGFECVNECDRGQIIPLRTIDTGPCVKWPKVFTGIDFALCANVTIAPAPGGQITYGYFRDMDVVGFSPELMKDFERQFYPKERIFSHAGHIGDITCVRALLDRFQQEICVSFSIPPNQLTSATPSASLSGTAAKLGPLCRQAWSAYEPENAVVPHHKAPPPPAPIESLKSEPGVPIAPPTGWSWNPEED